MNQTNVIKDFPGKTILISRAFDAPVAQVWRCYTEPKLLDQWWGPAPWRAETRAMRFEVGGYWLYVMIGPENEQHWGRMNYHAIETHRHIAMEDVFCDENGVVNTQLPVSTGSMVFTSRGDSTLVEFRMTYAKESDLQMIVEMGFEEGITLCLEQLAALLKRAPMGE